MNWRWIDKQALLLLHGESVDEHGGGAGIRDAGLLESALARPLNVAAIGTPDVSELAASYCIGLAKNRPFVDGNKRVAFLAVGMFLYLNGYRLQATQTEATLTILSKADGSLNESEFASWLRAHISVRTV